ncbi:cell wall-binding repeat-containing protein [Bacillus sp. Cs-700]|uniref:cell wall-binding repeat-containing protein n=1 Tax=Bacillus sp. Cs-700 TaxID=2589818 RepID=UPI00140900A7|nr:cell wall-binding repeat-containing protein [Bacillus sp. Cs-700]
MVAKKKAQFVFLICLVLMIISPSFSNAVSAEAQVQKWDYLALGDSLAHGLQYDGKDGLSYADYIADYLTDLDRLKQFNKSYARSGLTTSEMLAMLQTNADLQLAIANTDLITISVGANDLLEVLKKDPNGLNDPAVASAILTKARNNYGQIMSGIRKLNPDASIFLMGYYNSFYAYPKEQQDAVAYVTKELNKGIESIATASGSGFVPTYEAIAENYQAYLPNPLDVHPSQAGYQAIASEFWKQMKPALPIGIERIAGKDRYLTAVAISEASFEAADTVVLARGDDFPDALSGAPLAYKKNAPILLTGETLPLAVKNEINRLGAHHAIVLGGTGAVSDYVVNELKGLGLKTKRLGGKDRFETAAHIAAYLDGNPPKAVVANGMNFPDALSIASYAAKQGYPILLTQQTKLPAITETALLEFADSIIVGGKGVVSEKVAGQLPAPVRYGGANRYATSAEIAMKLNPADKAVVATGANFADALTGSILAARSESTFLLVPPTKMDESIQKAAIELGVRNFTILGGEGAVNQEVITSLQKIK